MEKKRHRFAEGEQVEMAEAHTLPNGVVLRKGRRATVKECSASYPCHPHYWLRFPHGTVALVPQRVITTAEPRIERKAQP